MGILKMFNAMIKQSSLDDIDRISYTYTVISYWGTWCLFRRNREAGVNPARSRHCNREFIWTYVTGKFLGRLKWMMILSQENCLF